VAEPEQDSRTAMTSAETEAPAAADESAQSETAQSGRSGRKAARGKRSSVPSWDEIMFGSSRQQD
jgi:hypothetical protein